MNLALGLAGDRRPDARSESPRERPTARLACSPSGTSVSVTAAGFRAAGVTAGLKSTGAGRRRSSSTTARRSPPPPSSPPTGARPTRCCGARRSSRTGAATRRRPQLRRRQLLHRADGLPTTHATAEQVADALGIGAGDVVGLLDRPDRADQRPCSAARRACDAADAALADDGGAGAAEAIMTTDTVPQDRSSSRAPAGSVGGMAKGAGMLAPALATMLVVLTTDAVVDAADLDAALRAATAGHLRPARLRRLHVDQRHRPADGHRRQRHHAVAGGLRRRRHAGPAPTWPMQLLADAEGADHDIAITVLQRRHRGRRGRGRPRRSPAATCSRPRSSARTPTGAGCSPRSAPRTRPSTRPTSTSRSTASGCAASSAPATTRDQVDLEPRERQRDRSTCKAGAAARPRSGPTTSPTPTSTRTRAYST